MIFKESTEKSFCDTLVFEVLIYSYAYIIIKLLLYGRRKYYRKEITAIWSFFHSFINNMKFNIVLQKLGNQRMIVGMAIYYEPKDNLKTFNYTISNAVSVWYESNDGSGNVFIAVPLCFPILSTIYQLYRGIGKPRMGQLPQDNSTIKKVKLISMKLWPIIK